MPCPERMKKISEEYLAGRNSEALSQQQALLPLIDAMFVETNPTPVKYALSKLGLCSEQMRLPMSQAGKSTRELIDGLIMAEDLF